MPGDRIALKTIYICPIRSVLDYGCIAFGYAANTILKKFDNIQYQALRWYTGAITTTPTSVLQVEMGEIPLKLRRVQLALSYWVNLRGHNDDNPTKDTMKPCWEKEWRETKGSGWTIE